MEKSDGGGRKVMEKSDGGGRKVMEKRVLIKTLAGLVHVVSLASLFL